MNTSTSATAAFDLTGRLALITGSSAGIGFALASGLAQAGASVILNARSTDKLDQAAPVAEPAELADYDAIIFGVSTRFGMMSAQLKRGPPR